MKRALTLSLLAMSTAALAPAGAQPNTQAPAAAPANAEDARLNTFLDAAYDARVALSPQQQTSLGLRTNYDKLDDNTDGGRRRLLDLRRNQLRDMRAQFRPERLSPAARLSFRLFELEADRAEEAFRWRWHSYNVNPLSGLPVFLINNHRIDNAADAEAYVARLRDSERALGESAANIRHQMSLGIVAPAFNFEKVYSDSRRLVEGAPFAAGADTAIFADFKTKVGRLDIAQAEKDRLIAAAGAALTGPFKRGYDNAMAALREAEARATAQGNRGAWSLPDGAQFYAFRLRNQTTTDLDADRIHQIGLDNVARIHGEMEAIKTRVGFTGSLRDFFTHVREGAEYKYSNTAEGRERYLADARAYIAKVMEAAPRFFHRLPRAPLEVRAVEPFRQATAAVAFYNAPAPDGSRPGIYYVNLADMTQVLKPQVEAISLHEGAPGHHFQVALAQELPDVPKFRRLGGGYTAYAEGWGLYAERLGKEMGFYEDPLSDFGRLSTELWRAIRLVTDTGIHAKRWTREQAINYFLENGLLSRLDATKEVERYFNGPGQATSYLIGQIKIVELREKARRMLGARFDIRDFHRVVLEDGPLPLDLLEEQVDAYIASRSAR